jgi:uncharacterized membrane protein YcjF (UPF0283 family)
MNDSQTSPTERNPVTQAVHRRQVFWQITLPLVLLVVIFLALSVVISLSGAGYQSRWADISLIWCLCPNLILLLLCVGSLGGMVYGLFRLQQILPGKLYRLQIFSVKVRDGVQKAFDVAVEPVLKVRSSRAGQKALWKNVGDLFKRPPRDSE